MTAPHLPVRRFVIACAFAAGLLAPAVAQAFTIEGGPGSTAGGSNWRDLDIPKPQADHPADSRFKSENGVTTFKQGNSTFYFGTRPSFDQRYNTNNLFYPYARTGRE